jgi:aspartyl-tRNA(Asn)/glutamyl-tRNA(Gln) amidotransferase subunit A
MNETDLAFASIAEIARLFRTGKLSPVELTKLMLARIERFNPKLNAYITVTADLSRSQAKNAEAELCVARGRKSHPDRGLLHGVPISLKDNICTAGVRTTAGSEILRNFFPERDAPLVTRLKQAGAVILGKTNMHEFAYGVTTNNPHYGPARNPWDEARIPGGSSGGSAAAVAAGLCFGNIGTDTGGSIRIPAALCCVFGLKPTVHRVDATGVIPLSPSLDCIGPLARTADDGAILLHTLIDEKNKTRRAPTRQIGRAHV